MANNPIQRTVQGYPVNTTGAAYIPRRVQAIQALALWKSESSPDLWLRQEIGMAFQQMIGLCFDKAPAVEMLPITAELWVSIISPGMVESLDRQRIKEGFKQLYRTFKTWPQPTDLLKILPGRPHRTRLPEPEVSAEVHQAHAAKLQDILDSIGNEMNETQDREERSTRP